MLLNMEKVKQTEGYTIGAITYNGKTFGVVTIPADGFARLVGFMGNNGKWVFVHKDFRK